ncbi:MULTISPECIES: hypothetical protein [unclassified Thioalkalivibrio]|uniref:hypothetical protein n=1 Tax=unclassified Thioalkalivibrio TaxID=2621013 RepID=UPI000364989E|nr:MULTISPECIES: hypothetical protein [unclassified Thioalkalivibrio]
MPIADPDRAPIRPRSARCTVRGSILLVALLILVLAGAIAVGAVSLVGSGSSTSADRVQSEQALFAAESGIRRMVAGEPACDGSTHAVGTAWFNCDPAPGQCDANRSLVQGWVGSSSPDGALALHQICVDLLGAGLPPCDDAAWECVQDPDDISPGGGGRTYENL